MGRNGYADTQAALSSLFLLPLVLQLLALYSLIQQIIERLGLVILLECAIKLLLTTLGLSLLHGKWMKHLVLQPGSQVLDDISQ